MNAQVVQFPSLRKPSFERRFREALTDPRTRAPVRDAIGWDDSQVSRFLSGQMGLNIEKIDAAVTALDLRVVTRTYLDAVCEIGKTGMNCFCAREGFGDCGSH